MKSMKIVFALALICCTPPLAGYAGSNAGCTLNKVIYNVAPEASKVTMALRGSVRYAWTRHADEITIGLSGAHSSLAPGNDFFRFSEGLVSAVKVDQPRADSVAIHLTLRDKVACTVSVATAGDRLVFKAASPGSPAGSAPSILGNQRINNGASHSISDSLLKVLPGEPIALGTQSEVSDRPGAPVKGQKTPVTLWMVLMVVSALSTGALLFILARRARKRTKENAPLAADPEPRQVRELATKQEDGETWQPSAEEEHEDADDRASMLAKGLQRGTGELQLAMKMHGDGRVPALHRAVHGFGDSPATDAGRTKIAKKLGVGRGEVDLAIRLREVSAHHGAMEERG